MRRIELIQGSQEWHAHRAKHFNASDAPAMMGVSKYKTRSDLLKELATGISPEIDPATQRRFDAGHAAEAAARPIVAAIIGDDLFPVTGVETVEGLPLSASFDGITLVGDIIWENKLLNGDLKADIEAADLAPHYWAQLEHQLLVSGADKAYFTTSDGTEAGTHGVWYESIPARRQQIINGWRQFALDLENYQPTESKPEAVAEHIEALPALLVQVEGRVLATNLDKFKEAATTFIANINTDLQTDNDFATADKMVKFLADGEKQLAQVKQHAQAQASDIDAVFRAIDDISAQMREKRLALDKLVKAEKENRKAEIVRGAKDVMMAHIDKLNTRIGGFMPRTIAPFAEAIKGLKSLSSMQDAVNTALANAKIEANEVADRIELNARAAKDHMHLLPDFAGVCTKATDDFAALLALRIQQDEQRKEAERERIRQEEADRISREAAKADLQAKAQAATDQRGKADAGSNASGEAAGVGSIPQPVAASTPPIRDDKAMIEAFLQKYVQAPRRNNIRSVLMAWEQFKREEPMEAAA